MQKTEDKNIQKKNPDKKKSQKVDQKTADKSQKNTNTNKNLNPKGMEKNLLLKRNQHKKVQKKSQLIN